MEASTCNIIFSFYISAVTKDQVFELVDVKLKERDQNSASELEIILAKSRESLLEESNSRAEALREELSAAQRDVVASLKRHVDGRLQDCSANIRDNRCGDA